MTRILEIFLVAVLLIVVSGTIYVWFEHDRRTKDLAVLLSEDRLNQIPAEIRASRVMSLVRAGARVNTRSKDRRVPLLVVSLYGTASQVQELLSRGAKVDDRDAEGITPLMNVGCSEDAGRIVELLVQSGGDVNAKDSEGRTPVIWCVRTAHSCPEALEALEVLVVHGADINKPDADGWTALRWAKEQTLGSSGTREAQAIELRIRNTLRRLGAHE
jgi:ankyrin repeat protein